MDSDFYESRDKGFISLPHPISLLVPRVAIEKNIDPFLSQDIPETKIVVGDGPQPKELKT